MEQTPKPIRRSKQLAPLSREHHEGLLFAWKIKQGLKNGTGINRIAAFVQWFWDNDLQEHFRKEEQVLAANLPAGDALVQQMIDEHQDIEALIRINENIADVALLEQLARAVNDHIRFEERTFFPHAEKTIPPEKLDLVFEQLSKQPAHSEKWEDEFWLKK